LPEVELVFLGGGELEVVSGLRQLSRDLGMDSRTHFLPAVPLEELISATREADVGVSLLEGNCENHRLALPNKVFEYVAAGVPVVVSDLPEVAQLVHERRIGWVVDAADAEDVGRGIRAAVVARGERELSARLEEAASELNWRAESKKLEAVYQELPTA
jgi:glycosyltransferase involved in cell wall biosynthesis